MTQPIMEEGRWAVLRNGEVAGPLEVNRNDLYPWVCGDAGYASDGGYWIVGMVSDLDIIATFPTRAEALAHAPRQPDPVAPETPAVDWEQRRWEAAKEALPAVIRTCAGDTSGPGETFEELFARRALSIADALIATLKGETK